jgi:transcriptional regulator with XRE-family HTH domain
MPRTAPTAKSKEVGARLRVLRKATGEKQAETAAAIGIERATLTGIETGAAMPGRETMTALAKHFGVSLDYLESGASPAGQDIPAEPVKDITEASLLRFWRLLDRAQQEELVGRMADMIGSRIAAPEPPALRHVPVPST